MPKIIFLIRHAQAESNNEIRDFDRQLTKRGIIEATDISERMHKHGLNPQLILSSPATRALSTAKIFAENLSLDLNKIQPENSIYEASITTLLSLINHLDDNYSTAALFGHNPGMSELLAYLSNGYFGAIPTSGVVMLEFDQENWNLISEGTGHVKWYAYP